MRTFSEYERPAEQSLWEQFVHRERFFTKSAYHFYRKSAYHLVPLKEEKKQIAPFEVGGKFYEFNRLSFWVIKALTSFQTIIDNSVDRNRLKRTYSYLYDGTIGAQSKEGQDKNFKAILLAAENERITLKTELGLFCLQETQSVCEFWWSIRLQAVQKYCDV